MKQSSYLRLMLMVVVCVGPTFCQESSKLSTVTLGVVDTFGHSETNCRVDRFVLLDNGVNADYESRFSGLVGENIPFGNSYEVHVRCPDHNIGGAAASVRREDQFIEVSVGPSQGDYFTGSTAKVTVLVAGSVEEPVSPNAWVEIVEVYGKNREVDKIAPDSSTAQFDEFYILPGKYLVLVQNGDKLACTEEIDVLGPQAKLKLSLSRSGCTVTAVSNTKVIDK